MKITKTQLKQIIKEELSQVLNENPNLEAVAKATIANAKSKGTDLKQLASDPAKREEFTRRVSLFMPSWAKDDGIEVEEVEDEISNFFNVKPPTAGARVRDAEPLVAKYIEDQKVWQQTPRGERRGSGSIDRINKIMDAIKKGKGDHHIINMLSLEHYNIGRDFAEAGVPEDEWPLFVGLIAELIAEKLKGLNPQ